MGQMTSAPADKKQDPPFAAIAIDTSVYEKYQFAFEFGILKRVEQFADSGVVVLFPEIVVRETTAHLELALSKAAGLLRKAVKGTSNGWGARSEVRSQALSSLLGQGDPAAHASEAVARFISAVDGIQLRADDGDLLVEVMDRYFAGLAPFGRQNKKAEFPDAICLLSLEAWAERHGPVAVVSLDEGWQEFCDESRFLTCYKDLGEALSQFREGLGGVVAQQLQSLLDKDEKSLRAKIEAALVHAAEQGEVSALIDSQFYAEDEGSEIALSLPDGALKGAQLELVDDEGAGHVFQVEIHAEASVVTQASFAKWDSVDREYVGMGTGELSTEEQVDLELLITVGMDPTSGQISIADVEASPVRMSVEYIDAEPSWMSSPEDYE